MKNIVIHILSAVLVALTVSYTASCFASDGGFDASKTFFLEVSQNAAENTVEMNLRFPAEGNGIFKISDENDKLIYVNAYFEKQIGDEEKIVFSNDSFKDGTYVVMYACGDKHFRSSFEIVSACSEIPITRAEFAVIAANKFYEKSDISGYSFHDTSDEDYWYQVCLLKKHGVLNGYENGFFEPKKALTSIELISVISRIYLDKTGCGYPENAKEYLNGALSAENIPCWAENDIALAVREGFFDGTTICEVEAGTDISNKHAQQIVENLSKLFLT